MTHCEWSRRVTRLCAALALAATPAAAQTPAAAPAPRQLSLDEALGLAEPVSDDIAIARAGLARAEGQRIRARSTFFPQLIGSASYIRTIKTQYSSFVSADTGKTAPQCNSFVPDSTLPIDQRVRLLERALGCSTGSILSGFSDLPFGRPNNWNLGLSASWTVFAGGRNRANVQAATATKAGAEVALTAARAQVMLDITQAYYDAALSDRQVGIAEATLAQAETTFTQTKLARQVGNQPEFDQLRAQVTRDNQRPVVIQRQTEREIAYLRLKQLLNLPLDQPLILTTDLNDSTAQPGSRLASLVSQAPDTAVEERAPVRQARQSVRASDESYTAAHAQRFPAITLSSAYGRVAYPNSAFPSWGSFLDNWTVTAGLQVPIFIGGRIKGDEEIARAEPGRGARAAESDAQAGRARRAHGPRAACRRRRRRGRRARARRSRPRGRTRSRRCDIARGSPRRPSSATRACSWSSRR